MNLVRTPRFALPAPALTLALTLLAAPAAWGRPAQDAADDSEGKAFQIYDTQAVRARVESAEDHLDAERWSEALVDLQALLEEHWGEVLPAARPRARLGRAPSLVDVHGGAGAWARRTLVALPPDARELYQERYGLRARRALEAALASGDRAGLTSIAMRWPVTREARRAWWALGDLELELGNTKAALAAWARGMRAEVDDEELDLERGARWREALDELVAADPTRDLVGVRARIEFAARLLEDRVEGMTLDPPPSTSTALSPGGASPRLGRQMDRWPEPHELTGPDGLLDCEHPFGDEPRARFSLFPTRYGGLVFYSSSRNLVAVESFTGATAWRTPPDMLAWQTVARGRIEDLAKFDPAIEFEESLIQPAAAQGVVVAALQVPIAFEDEDSYGDLEIIRVVPERRLFAFDAETGELLWETLPPWEWDGESGSFAERMTIVGSPRIEGSRVIVPTARVRGRIELFIGCFDLHTGEVLWSTPLITGQRPLNMFGRLVEEYAAPPVVVDGDRVVVATQLGTVACLGLFTGETLWQATYDQIPIIAGDFYHPGRQQNVWRNAPPAVADGVAVVAPHDGYDLVGYDLETGAALWSIPQATLSERVRRDRVPRVVDVLLHADERRVYLGGQNLAVFSAPGGLAREAPLQREWVYPADERFRDPDPRPVVTRDRIYVSQRNVVEVIDRRNGKLLEAVEGTAWGNLLVGDGMLFTFSVYALNGYFEWESMLRRARANVAAAPGDVGAVEALARILYKRGLSATTRADYRAAARWYEDAREAVESLDAGDGPAGVVESLPALRECLYDVLRAEGRNARLGADPRIAVRSLQRAREFAPDPESRLAVLLEEAEVLREREPAAWLEVLGEIYDSLADQVLLVEAVPGAVPGAPWTRLEPVQTRLPGSEDKAVKLRVPAGLWVLVERIGGAPDGRAVDHGREFADLHAILHRYAGQRLVDGTAGQWATERVAAKLDSGETRGYAPFAARADELLELALSARDLKLLERVGALFPHSPAARRANEARFDLFLAAGELGDAARVALDELPEDWHPARREPDHEAHARRLVQLAEALGERGNRALRAGVSRSLAQAWGDLEFELAAGEVRPLREWSAAWGEAAAEAQLPEPSFGADPSEVGTIPSSLPFEPLGPIPAADPAGDADEVRLYCDGWTLYAFSDSSGGRAIWSRGFGDPRVVTSDRDPLPAEFGASIRVTPGRVHVGTHRSLTTLDRDTGEELWTWETGLSGIDAVEASDGIVLVHQDMGIDRPGVDEHRITGLDAALGLPLWEVFVSPDEHRRRMIVGDGRLVILPLRGGDARIFDLFTGREVARFELGFCLMRTALSAWIDDGRVLLPFFSASRSSSAESNGISAYDLETGARAWNVPFADVGGRDWELNEIFTYEDETFLLLRPSQRGTRLEPGLFALNTRLGALTTRPLAEVPDGRLLGAGMGRRTVLRAPYLFALERPTQEGGSFVVRAIHLRFGERWRARIARGARTLNAYDMPMPAISGDTVALTYVVPDERAGSRGRQPKLALLDRTNGRERELVDLPHELFGTTAPIRLDALGETLFVCGARMMQWMR